MDKNEELSLPNISPEQLQTVNMLKDNNIIVDSVAGSGKTTTVLYIAKNYPDRNILLLTYNKKLKMETREKVKKHHIKNLETHSYHSFCVKYYKRDCFTDYGIIDVVKKNAMILKPFSYDTIILDEAQDICPLYYQLIVKIFEDNEAVNLLDIVYENNNTNICILGDQYQSIYDFNNADSRFIVYGDKLFNFNSLKWTRVNLHTSFRITQNMADFVNYCMLGYNWNSDSFRIKSYNKKRGLQNRVRYIICDTFGYVGKKDNQRPYEEIEHYLSKGYNYDEIFVLAPSVKSNMSPVRKLANKLSDKGVPVYVPVSDEEVLDEDILKNKLVFSTFHQSKGLERKVIIVFSFDDSYFKYYKKEKNPNVCPNELYVACTRGKEHLSVFHHYQNEYLPFLNKIALHKFCYFEDDIGLTKKRSFNNEKPLKTEVTDLLRHLPISVIKEALGYLDITTVQKPGPMIDIAVKTKQKELYEGVSEITGIAIPSYFELMKTGKMSIFKDDMEYILEDNFSNLNEDNEDNDDFDQKIDNYMFIDEMDEVEDYKLDDYMFVNENGDNHEEIYDNNEFYLTRDDITIDKLTCEQLLYISNIWNCYKTGYKYKINQIQDYNWLTKDKLIKCVQRLKNQISEKSLFEQEIDLQDEDELLGRKLVGYIDCVDIMSSEKDKDDVVYNIWELKSVKQLENEHILQLAVYMYLFEKNKLRRADRIKNRLECKIKAIKEDDDSLFRIEDDLNLEEGDTVEFVYLGKVYEGIINKIFKNGNVNVKVNNDAKFRLFKDEIICNKTIKDKDKANDTKNVVLNDYALNKIKNYEEQIKDVDNELNKSYNYYLYNILDDHKIKIDADIKSLENLVEYLIYNKYYNSKKQTDKEFIDYISSLKI